MHRVCKRAVAALSVGLLLVGLGGCSSDRTAEEVAALNKSNAQRVVNMYAAFQVYKGRGPKSEAEFKEFVAAFDAEKLKMMGIEPSDLAGLFTSERDGKPFKIRYNVGGGRGSVDPVVFEQDGTGGTRLVGFTGGKVEEADASTYQQLWAGKRAPDRASADPKGGRPSGPPAGAPKGPES